MIKVVYGMLVSDDDDRKYFDISDKEWDNILNTVNEALSISPTK